MEKAVEVVRKEPSDLIRIAIEKGADLEKLEKVLQLQAQYDAMEAKKAYHKSMAAFKANPPRITKDKTVSFGAGRASYTHASLANVTDKISTELSKYGLSASWRQSQNGQIVVTCRITHELGHHEETALSAPSDTSGSKNAIQAIGSTVTYLERYTLLSLCGLATCDMDDDAVASDPISQDQVVELQDLIDQKKVDRIKFYLWLKIASLEVLPKARYNEARAALIAKKSVS